MRIKGLALVERDEAVPVRGRGGVVAIALAPEVVQLLGCPDGGDVIMAFRADAVGAVVELVCLTDLPESCRSPRHLAEAHMDEIEEAVAEFKRKEARS